MTGLYKKVSVVFFWKCSGIALTFLLQILLARWMSLDEYGAFLYLFAWLSLFTLLCKFGLDNSAMRFLPNYKSAGDGRRVVGFLLFATGLVAALSLLTAGILHVSILVFPSLMDSYQPAMQWLVILLPLNAVATLLAGFMRASHAQRFAEFIEIPFRQIAVMAGCWGVIQASGALDLGDVLAVYSTITALMLAIFLVRSFSRFSLLQFWRQPLVEGSRWVEVSFALLLSAAMYMIQNQADVLMIGIYMQASDVALYGVASRFSTIMTSGLAAVTVFVAPTLAQYFSANMEAGQIQKFLSKTSLLLVSGSIVVAASITVAGPFALSLFGDSYVAAYGPLLILVWVRALDAIAGPTGQILAVSGGHWVALGVSGFSATLNIAGNMVLIPKFGLHGAAVATGLSILVWNLLLLWHIRFKYGLDPSVLGYWQGIKWSGKGK